jgi:hypothetical protein
VWTDLDRLTDAIGTLRQGVVIERKALRVLPAAGPYSRLQRIRKQR